MWNLLMSQLARVGGYVFMITFYLVINDGQFFELEVHWQYITIIIIMAYAVGLFMTEKTLYEQRLKDKMEE